LRRPATAGTGVRRRPDPVGVRSSCVRAPTKAQRHAATAAGADLSQRRTRARPTVPRQRNRSLPFALPAVTMPANNLQCIGCMGHRDPTFRTPRRWSRPEASTCH
jgi:hypothetical protein